MSYEELLKRGLSKVPKKAEETERFSVPKARIQPDGARTIIINFLEMADGLRRDPQHLLKYMLKELATKGDLEKGRLTVIGRFNADHINRKVEGYVKAFVICSECGKPDTKIIKQDRYHFLKCEACGARHSISRY
ncbi:MAG: translation initiation factor IF-2 subunit beta [Candidatus Aenigmarchaeota archaeon]